MYFLEYRSDEKQRDRAKRAGLGVVRKLFNSKRKPEVDLYPAQMKLRFEKS